MPDNPINLRVGDEVYVRLHDARVLHARVDAVFYTVSGWRARVTSGATVRTITLDQIVAPTPSQAPLRPT